MMQAANWYEIKDGDPRAVGLYQRHYSCYKPKNGRKIDRVRYGFSGNGQSIVLLTQDCRALFCWRLVKTEGVNCSVFRNEGDILSSDLIREADSLAWQKWAETRHYTFVDSDKIESTNPGYCFLQAGWHKCGVTKRGLIILEVLASVVGENLQLVTDDRHKQITILESEITRLKRRLSKYE